MNPKVRLSEDVSLEEIEYKWIASSGGFIESETGDVNNEVINNGESVKWTPLSDGTEKLSELIEIKLEVVSKKQQKIIAKDKIEIKQDGDIYFLYK